MSESFWKMYCKSRRCSAQHILYSGIVSAALRSVASGEMRRFSAHVMAQRQAATFLSSALHISLGIFGLDLIIFFCLDFHPSVNFFFVIYIRCIG